MNRPGSTWIVGIALVALAGITTVGCGRTETAPSLASLTAPSTAGTSNSARIGTNSAPGAYDGSGQWHVHGVDHVGNIIDFDVTLNQDADGNLTGSVANGSATIQVVFTRDGNGIGERMTYKLSITGNTAPCALRLTTTPRGTAQLNTDTNIITATVAGIDSKCNEEPGIDLTFTRI